MTPFPPVAVPFPASVWIAARLLPACVGSSELDRLLAMATPPPGASAYREFSAQAIVSAVKRAARRPWVMRDRRCLREGLLAFRYLSLAGHRPQLHFALEPGSLSDGRLSAHCWITVGGEVLMNPPTPTMMLLFVWDGARMTKPEGMADATVNSHG
ncbi:lasso peptide biosynthesis B2 protein [Aquibium microcysteis]|uniref:lasso peptide biosynthesis B2 protein n=1 Tax=Aquibium microcysteis TaxID=675281 RepID=UPI00165D27FE|nr:lasso peptide biosynthesis B2 protein [Aquibium microcysteis]